MFNNQEKEKLKKTELVQIRMSKGQKETLKKMASNNNMNASEFILFCLEKEYQKQEKE